MSIGLNHFLIVAALLFSIGFFGMLLRRNVLVLLMCVELMLNASTVALVAFSRYTDQMDGAMFVFFIITVAAAEVAVGLAIIVSLYRRKQSLMAEDYATLKN